MQSQLALIFEEAQVCQQLEQDINDFCQLPHLAKLLSVELLYLADEQFIFKVRLNGTFVQLFGGDVQQEEGILVRLVFPRQYPRLPPRIYFESEVHWKLLQDLNERYTVPGRDYFAVLWPQPWEEKLALNELLPRFVGLLNSCQSISHPQSLAVYQRGEFFDYTCFVGKRSCQFYPVLVVLQDETTAERYLVLHRYDLLLFEPTNIPGYLRLVDCYSLRSVSMVMSHRQETQHRLLLSIKLERCEALLELFSENCSAIAQSIIDRKMKLPVNYENTIVRQWKLPLSAHEPTNCEQFNEHIRNCEEMLDKKPCEQITARLMELCNKAIEYCTVVSDQPHEIYLEKLQRLISMRGSQAAHQPSIFSDCEQVEKETFHDKLHDLSQVTCASSDMFELA